MDMENEGNEPGLFSEKELVYSLGSPIMYSPIKSFDDEAIIRRGRVLLCHAKLPRPKQSIQPNNAKKSTSDPEIESRKLFYTISAFLRDGSRGYFEVIDNVTSDRLRYVCEEASAEGESEEFGT